jgi:hypothetical protein
MSDMSGAAEAASGSNRVRSGALLIFGVGLPVIALAVELAWGFNASEFFDPLPTYFHVLLVAFVAAANAAVWFAVSRGKLTHVRALAFANGVTIGIAAFYSVLFLPLLPLGAIGLLYFGLGALVWAPLLSFIVALRLRVHLSRCSERKITRLVWGGVAAGFLVLIGLDMPSTLTRIGVAMATAETAEKRTRGIRLLRNVGSEEQLLRMCYVRSGSATDLIGFFIGLNDRIETKEARQIYYRVTGQAFNSVPPPPALRHGRHGIFDWDQDVAGEAVGGRVRGLSLASSRLDGSINADAALAYLEWTMVVRNQSPIVHEARAQIALPPGAVVTRLTLWIEGEEREAAFAGRREVREAYRTVVSRRRDPVLVTSAGPDRIGMQMFPVPASGEMKVRIGMTVPLRLMDARDAALRLPHFHERNFDIREELHHAVWIESKAKIRTHLAQVVVESRGSGVIRTEVSDARLASADASVVVLRSDRSNTWSPDPQSSGHVIRQTIDPNPAAERPRRLVLVVDGSSSMREASGRIAKILSSVPAGMDINIVLSRDEGEPLTHAGSNNGNDAANLVTSFTYAGGKDNTSALARGMDLAFAQPDAVLLWVHGPQPVLLNTEEALLQRLTRGPRQGEWYDLQVTPGRNLVIERLDGFASPATIDEPELERLVGSWGSGQGAFIVTRERIEKAGGELPAEGRTSDHLARLWANDEVGRLIRIGGIEARRAAVGLAQDYQLVTPVSGAVVLETRQQYRAAGLEPVPEGSVPTIPEPEEWLLIVIALAVLVYAYRSRSRLSARAI